MNVTALSLTALSSTDHGLSGGINFHSHSTTVGVSSADIEVNEKYDIITSNINRSSNIVGTSFSDIHNNSAVNLSEVHSMCPGAVEFYTDHTGLTMYPVQIAHCKQAPWRKDLRFQHHWLYGQCEDHSSFCHVPIQVPSSMIIRTRVEYLELVPGKSIYRRALYLYEKKQTKCRYTNCFDTDRTDFKPRYKPFFFLSTTNQLYVYYANRPRLSIKFEGEIHKLDVKYMSNQSGFVTIWHQEGEGKVCDQLIAPNDHVIMVSFEQFLGVCGVSVSFGCRESGNTGETWNTFRTDTDKVSKVCNASHLQICVRTGLVGYISISKSCFKLLFSFHPADRVPQRHSSGLYNCSVDYYWRFQQHLHCNLEVDCADGRDEAAHCPYSSPACTGWVASHQKCYKRFKSQSRIGHRGASGLCRTTLGFELASIKTQQEFRDFRRIVQKRGFEVELIGLIFGFESLPSMYRYFFSWADKTVIYNVKHIVLRYPLEPEKTLYYHKRRFDNTKLYAEKSTRVYLKHTYYICEKPVRSSGMFPVHSVEFSSHHQSILAFTETPHSLSICSAGHVTHSFLSCDRQSRCGQTACFFTKETGNVSAVTSAAQHSVDTVAMFSCTSGDTELSYALLCDFRQDCADNSDESFCHHPACKEVNCTNGQCLPLSKHCNKYVDCMDGTDEEGCPLQEEIFYTGREYQNQNKSFVINLDGNGYFTQTIQNLTDPCPATHYRCTKEWFYCLPVYTRCNGVFDCIFQEDEGDCGGWTCPGLYHCRGSTVCLLADHMCDGWPQCPQRDDEWLCDMTCPVQCLCQGHAFLCPQPFSAHLFPQLRYLDARGSGMTPSDLRNNTYIVRLSLAQCNISVLSDLKFPNLQVLDLSFNKITGLVMNVFNEMQNLQVFILKWNPLVSVTESPVRFLQTLAIIDLSGTRLRAFGPDLLTYTPRVQYINISFSAIHSLDSPGFQGIPHLREIDLRGTTIDSFPLNLFRGLTHVDNIYASYYRLCCKEVVPLIAPVPRCLAPQHHLSSCENMIRSEVYRFSLWFVAVLAGVGSVLCFATHSVSCWLPVPYGGPVVVFVTSLQSADFSMGIYASVIAAAHETFRGQYFHAEDRWKESEACKVAGFLSTLSGEVSILILLLLSVEHLILLCFPCSTYRFNKGSAALACGLAWFVGIVLASIPLFPGHRQWGYYGQTALCSLMLHDRRKFSQTFRFIHAILVFNVSICLTVLAFQVIIYRATPRHWVLSEQNVNPAYTSVNFQLTIATTAIARWVAITMTSLLALAGVAAGSEVNVFMAVMVMPLNSAVNPALCLWHAVSYRQRLKQEERLLRVLRSRRKAVPLAANTARKGNNRN